jgi:hypothetical protein
MSRRRRVFEGSTCSVRHGRIPITYPDG